jgi:hypothetical protein
MIGFNVSQVSLAAVGRGAIVGNKHRMEGTCKGASCISP